ncbi:uncharacterized protein LOC141893178 isoform X1 [Acropora palmata]|uniref:uncharacterized protein LOC141893178 isoform X1 n=1 Tax=Acropora palmata TaxID=6131 RepID=UPI003DA138E8
MIVGRNAGDRRKKGWCGDLPPVEEKKCLADSTGLLSLLEMLLKQHEEIQCSCYKCCENTNAPELRWMGDSAPKQLKNLASGQNQECFCALAVCKTLRDSQMITMADCVWSDVEALSV